MPLIMTPEHDHVFRLDLHGRLRKADFERCEQQLEKEIVQNGPVRLLILLDGFTGWDPGAPWNDLAFYMKHGDAIERIAIVGPDRWRSHMLMFAGADLTEFAQSLDAKKDDIVALARRGQRLFRRLAECGLLARAADVDVALKNSGPPLETLSAYVGDLIAGR